MRREKEKSMISLAVIGLPPTGLTIVGIICGNFKKKGSSIKQEIYRSCKSWEKKGAKRHDVYLVDAATGPYCLQMVKSHYPRAETVLIYSERGSVSRKDTINFILALQEMTAE